MKKIYFGLILVVIIILNFFLYKQTNYYKTFSIQIDRNERLPLKFAPTQGNDSVWVYLPYTTIVKNYFFNDLNIISGNPVDGNTILYEDKKLMYEITIESFRSKEIIMYVPIKQEKKNVKRFVNLDAANSDFLIQQLKYTNKNFLINYPKDIEDSLYHIVGKKEVNLTYIVHGITPYDKTKGLMAGRKKPYLIQYR